MGKCLHALGSEAVLDISQNAEYEVEDAVNIANTPFLACEIRTVMKLRVVGAVKWTQHMTRLLRHFIFPGLQDSLTTQIEAKEALALPPI